MEFEAVRVVGGPLAPVLPGEVDALEARLWIALPAGYREYVTRLGEGVLGSFVRIYPPRRVEWELAGWRRRINKYWCWDEGADVLPKERALECVVIGDTVSGDELVFHPVRPDRLFVLPRHTEQVFEVGEDVLAAVDWMLGSGELTDPVDELDLEPFDSRPLLEDERAAAVVDPEGESLDDLIELGKRWAARHSGLDLFRDLIGRRLKGDREARLLAESIVLKGDRVLDEGYAAVYAVVDKASGLEVGRFRGTYTGQSISGDFEPNRANEAKLSASDGP